PATPTPRVIVLVATPTPVPGGAAAGSVDSQAAPGSDSEEMRRVAAYQRVSPAVVNITTQILRTDFFWGAVPEEGSGSGFLWDNDGHLVTNYHVVEGAQEISVSFGNDVNLSATVVGTDPQNDLAVLSVKGAPADVEPVQLGASKDLKVGQSVYAIGNPFGQFERTMTQGIVSALNRTIQTENNRVLRGIIQTDAAINRGNSGGPLLDSSGRLIGVNSAIYSPTGTSAGVGLAIPVDKVRLVVPELIKSGRYPHPWLGLEELGYEISPALARGLDLPVQQGLLIARVYQGSPADQAGVRAAQDQAILGNRRYLVGGDILTAIDGRPLTKWEQLNAYLDEEAHVGQAVTLSIVRNGEELALQATLADTPEQLR
ncbi:MAG: S1C family serine protease, partial [Nitrososphaerales archaeon]